MVDQLVQDIADDIDLRRTVRSVAGTIDDLGQAYGIQEKLRPLLGPICGRKIAMNTSALMAAAGVDDPIVGYVVGAEPLGSGVTLRPSEYGEMALEPEFAAVVGKDIAAGTVVSEANLHEYVDRFSMAIEVLDKRKDTHPMHAPTYVVNNVYSAGVVLADAALSIDAIADGDYHSQFEAAGDILLEGANTAPQNPLAACAFVINHFTQRGDTVKAGEVILCGAHLPPKAYALEGEYIFSLSSGESVSLSISL